MKRKKNQNATQDLTVPDDLVGLTEERIAKEQQMFEDRAERVQWRIHRNVSFTPSNAAEEPKPTEKPIIGRSL